MFILVVDAVDPEPRAQGWTAAGLNQAIAALTNAAGDTEVRIVPIAKIGSADNDGETVWCPLTVSFTAEALPAALRSHSLLSLASSCGEIEGMRQEITQHLDIEGGDGTLWLPVVVTAKGPLYAEAIAPLASDGDSPNYQQPFHLSDRHRQTVYRFARQVLQQLDVPPAVYLIGLGMALDADQTVTRLWFDRVLPFPGEPAIASIGVQTPDLFTCHWRCLTGQPIHDIIIP
ncbi:MAG: hypothetical protein AAGF75_05950 [Cyanobacteria bacterium P01_H01_bin.130]